MTLTARDENSAKPHLCIVAHNAFSAVFPAQGQAVGGAETRAWTIAKGLQQTGRCGVSFVVRSFRQLPAQEVEGVEIVRLPTWFPELRRRVSECLKRKSGFPGVRLVKFRPGLLWEVPFLLLIRPFRPPEPQPLEADPELMKLEPAAFLVFGTSADSSTVVAAANELGVPLILLLRSNADIPAGEDERDRYGESRRVQEYVLRHASRVFCQNETQQQRLREQMSIEAESLPAPIELERWPPGDAERGEYVLWVGRSDRFHKRPELLIELARRCAEIPFLLVMNRQDPDIYKEIVSHLPANVTHREYVPFDKMPEVYAKARVLVMTGNPEYEGFPNVFLQAAATGVPVVSSHDFNGFLDSTKAGNVVGEDLDEMERQVRRVWENRPPELVDPQELRDWIASHHSVETVCRKILEAFGR
jgi:glycosyltransferase involved in cell wall biosynthesis